MQHLYNPEDLKVGTFLIAEPFMQDPTFFRSVVMLVEHNEDGTLGFAINKRLELLLPDLVEAPEGMEFPVYLGGPVQQDTLFFMHSLGESIDNSLQVRDNLWWSGDFNSLFERYKEGLVSIDNTRIFLGYSGWGLGQLIEECEAKSWLTAIAASKFVFEDDDKHLWQKILGSLGGAYSEISRFPVHPSMN